ncbi:YhdH/YhfP family quinone oxidoreductase [Vagococcus zengguangii]|uniref:Acryloyl-CoA reductase n=1 Tax=Vagococcus zengguangii TaxID=2571750 RepID=A0A4D7CTC1_9ENTE|nr:YhdH/YhfP family quinone oxidoreductase [Vagococcus zengguangii]QCI85636.1 acryloyl-CoA reductase [Vagococcus zengguangii]TLG81576.1 acryloyl-CoA reductase [Vagococcus zengguangii]
MTYQCLEFQKDELSGKVIPVLTKKDVSATQEEEVQIKVHYSSVNYKDALASDHVKNGVIAHYPLVGGIDLSGEIINSKDERFKVGDRVVVTGYGLGVSHPGGYSEIAQVPADWVTKLPSNLTTKEAMIYGTAGITAALSIEALLKNGLAENFDARLLVTGATGGVGSLAISILNHMGYRNISALSRKKGTADDYLLRIGAHHIVTLEELTPEKVRPLMKQQFDFILDAVGGEQLIILLPQLAYGGCITLCGNAAGIKLNTTVLPFILRGISMIGIDSVNITPEKREHMWEMLANKMKPDTLETFVKDEVSLEKLPATFTQLLDGTMVGRYLVTL